MDSVISYLIYSGIQGHHLESLPELPSHVYAFSAVCPLVPFPRPFSWPFTELQNGRPLRSVGVPVSCSLSQDSFEWENQSPFLFTLAPKLFCSVYVRPAFSCCWRKRGGLKVNHVVVSETERFILPWLLDISPEQQSKGSC